MTEGIDHTEKLGLVFVLLRGTESEISLVRLRALEWMLNDEFALNTEPYLLVDLVLGTEVMVVYLQGMARKEQDPNQWLARLLSPPHHRHRHRHPTRPSGSPVSSMNNMTPD